MPKPKMFTVWFEQVNQCNYEVKAHSAQGAVEQARRKWKRENDPPSITYVEDETGENDANWE